MIKYQFSNDKILGYDHSSERYIKNLKSTSYEEAAQEIAKRIGCTVKTDLECISSIFSQINKFNFFEFYQFSKTNPYSVKILPTTINSVSKEATTLPSVETAKSQVVFVTSKTFLFSKTIRIDSSNISELQDPIIRSFWNSSFSKLVMFRENFGNAIELVKVTEPKAKL